METGHRSTQAINSGHQLTQPGLVETGLKAYRLHFIGPDKLSLIIYVMLRDIKLFFF